MSVVGIDFGNDTCKIAVAHKKQITVVANDVSKRRTPSCVSYTSKERRLGESAFSQWKSNYKTTINEIKRFIGRPTSDPTLQSDLDGVFYKVTNTGNQLGVEVTVGDASTTLTFEQILGSLFTRLKEITQNGIGGQNVRDVVISVPSYFPENRRRAIINAARTAGLNVLRLMNETTAVALSYGILRPLPKDTTNRVVFVDLGHANTNVAVVDFTAGKLTVKGTASDPNLGGRDIDRRLSNHFIQQFKDKRGLDLRERPKSALRIGMACEKIKKTLSSNNDSITSVECVWDDYDATLKMKREEFEEMCDDIFDRMLVPIKEALAKTETSVKDVFAVELIGGGHRIPAIQRKIMELFQRTSLSFTLNAEEALCRGCALMCASLSPTFIVKKFEVLDCVTYPVSLAWGPIGGMSQEKLFNTDGIDSNHESTLFYEKDAMPITKTIVFEKFDPFRLLVRYAEPEKLPPGTNEVIGAFTIDQIPALKKWSKEDGTKAPTMKIKIPMTMHGLVGAPSATLVEQIMVEEEQTIKPDPKKAAKKEKKDSPLKQAANAAKDDAKDKSDEPAPMETDAGNTAPAPADGDAKPADEPAPMDTGDSEPKKEEPPQPTTQIVQVKKKVRTNITVDQHWNGVPPPKVLEEWYSLECQMIAQDKQARDTADKRNELETYVYDMRDKIYDSLQGFIEDSARSAFSASLDSMEEWLYDEEGENAQKSTYQNKLDGLKKIGEAAERRRIEAEHRPSKVEGLKREIVKFQMFAIGSGTSFEEQYGHIPKDDLKMINKEAAAVDTWLQERLMVQDTKKPWDDPAMTCEDITRKLVDMCRVCQPVMDKPKPKPKPEPKPEPKKDDAKKDAEAGAGDKKAETGTGATEDASAKPAEAEQTAKTPADKSEKMDIDMDSPD